ncbi:MAG: hypothetical protein R3F01_05415 [Lysobacteraceae bacterium]
MVNKLLQLTAVVVAALLSIAGQEVSLSSGIAAITTLVGLAGVVVTVFGIWVAIIFPRVLSGLESGSSMASLPEKSRFDSLISSLYKSCFVMSAAGFVLILVVFYGSDDIYLAMTIVFFCWLSFFSLVSSLWVAVINGEVAAGHGVNVSNRKGTIERTRSLGRKASKGQEK